MYLVVIGWMYIALMMAVAEATHSQGTLLGAIVTFFLYGLLPVALVVYLMRTPLRRRARQARETAEQQTAEGDVSAAPDAGSHAPGPTEPDAVAPVREKP